ncbi:MAG: SDR family oxidoreductase [Sphingobacteriales bacterium JAD_PAG50586_3]|nr:MAG: SDR family oxidoreductase [Sphingobacteriales bacterium JAD_PAG50586_3]
MRDKVVIVTGASSGIGLACAEEFAARGAKVVLAARSIDALTALKTKLEAQGTQTLVVATDVSKEADCQNLVEQTVNTFGQIDILVNNAGLSMRAAFNDADLDVLRKLIDVNFWGTVYCTKYALPYILKTGGTVVGVSSIAGFKGLPGRTGYSASKFAMNGFLESLRIENLNKGINVLTVCPGFTASNIRNVALGKDGKAQGESPRDEQKMMQPEEVAKHMVKAILKRKKLIVLTIQGKLTVLLNKLFPAWVDKLTLKEMAKENNAPF